MGLYAALSAGGGGRSFSGCFAFVAYRFWMWQCRDAYPSAALEAGQCRRKPTLVLFTPTGSIPYGPFRATAAGAIVSRYVRQGQAPGRCARCHARRLRDKATCFREGAARGHRMSIARCGLFLLPVLCAVPDGQDFSNIILELLHDDVGVRNQFARAFPLSRPADARECL
jgi:hypothetical protein